MQTAVCRDVSGLNRENESRTLCGPVGKLSSPKSSNNLAEAGYGAPPTPLYSMKSSNSAGSPDNPRIVPRRKMTTPCMSAGSRADNCEHPKVPILPLRYASASAPCTPRDPSPRWDSTSSDRERKSCVRDRPSSPVTTLCLLNNNNSQLIHSRSTDTDLSDDDNGIVGRCSGIHGNCAANLDNSAEKIIIPPGRAILVRGTPPQSPRVSANTQSSILLATAAGKVHQRRHTSDAAHQLISLKSSGGGNESTAVPGDPNAARTGTGLSVRAQLLGMRDALDGLCFTWLAAAGGSSYGYGKTSKVSPSVSMQALDQKELETKPFEP